MTALDERYYSKHENEPRRDQGRLQGGRGGNLPTFRTTGDEHKKSSAYFKINKRS